MISPEFRWCMLLFSHNSSCIPIWSPRRVIWTFLWSALLPRRPVKLLSSFANNPSPLTYHVWGPILENGLNLQRCVTDKVRVQKPESRKSAVRGRGGTPHFPFFLLVRNRPKNNVLGQKTLFLTEIFSSSVRYGGGYPSFPLLFWKNSVPYTLILSA